LNRGKIPSERVSETGIRLRVSLFNRLTGFLIQSIPKNSTAEAAHVGGSYMGDEQFQQFTDIPSDFLCLVWAIILVTAQKAACDSSIILG
jgi:hypothetical protein